MPKILGDIGGPVGDLSGTSEDLCGMSAGTLVDLIPGAPQISPEVAQRSPRVGTEAAQRSRKGRAQVAQRSRKGRALMRATMCNIVQQHGAPWCVYKRVRHHTYMQVSLPRKCVEMFRMLRSIYMHLPKRF